jgi:hypothetical protein
MEKRIQEKLENEVKMKTEIASLKRQVTFFKDVEKTLRKASDMSKIKLRSSMPVETNKTSTVKVDISGKYSKKRNASDHNVQQSNMTMSAKIVRASVSPFIKKINPILSVS